MPAIQTTGREFAPSESAASVTIQRWEMHVGVHKVYIVGPGHGSMWAVTEPCYRGQVGTDEERRIVRNAVAILSREQRDNSEATIEMIMEVMRRAEKGSGDIEPEVAEALVATKPVPVANKPSPSRHSPNPMQGKRKYVVGDWRDRGWSKRGEHGFWHKEDGKIVHDAQHRNDIDFMKGRIKLATSKHFKRSGRGDA